MRKRYGLPAGVQTVMFVERYASLRALCAVVVLLAVSSLAIAADSDASADIVVTFLSGNVVVTQPSQSTVRVGSKLVLPASVRTGGDGTIELRQNRTIVTVAANSIIDIPVTGLASGKIDRVIQSTGSVFYRVEPREMQKLRVETPYLVAVIKGTQFNVVVQPDSATVALFEGLLQINSNDNTDSVDLNAGEIATRFANDARIRVLRMSTGETLRAQLATPVTTPVQNAAATPARMPAIGIAGALPSSSAVGGGVSVADNSASTRAAVTAAPNGVGATGNLKTGVGAVSAVTVGSGATNISAGVSIGVAPSAGSVAVNAGVSAGAIGANASVVANTNLATGSAAIGTNANIAVGGVSANAAIASTVNVSPGSVALGANVGASTAIANTPVAATTAVGLGVGATTNSASTQPVNVGANVATTAAIGTTTAAVTAAPAVSLGSNGASAGATVGAALGSSTQASTTAPVVGAAVNANTGSVGATVSLGSVNIGVAVPLDTGLLGGTQTPATSTSTATTTTTPAIVPVTPAPNPGNNNNGLIGRLRILNGSK